MQGLRAGDPGYRPAEAGATAWGPGGLQILTQITDHCYVGRGASRPSRVELSSQTSQKNVIHSSIQVMMVEQRPKTDQDSAPPGAAILAGESDDKRMHRLMWL